MKNAGPTNEDRQQACLRPDAPAVMKQSWRDLLFVHWLADPDLIQQHLPPGLTVDTFEGRAYLGFVPFFMRNIRPRFLPAVPGISNFLELNVRTYVYDEHNRPGVWFYSLDANQSLAVKVARQLFHLPYFRATMSAERNRDSIRYSSHRRDCPAFETSTATYTPGADLPAPEPGSLEFFLLERYYLFSWNPEEEQLYSGRVHHSPYPPKQVVVEDLEPWVLRYNPVSPAPDASPVHQVYSHGVDVDVFALEPVI